MNNGGEMQQLLIVDDDIDIATTLKEIFEDEGYDVHCEPNGMRALQFLKSQHDKSWVVLLDLMMPVMDGFEFRAKQKQEPELSHIPVVMMSAGMREFPEAMLDGAKAFISKPIQLRNLLSVIEAQK